MKPERIKEFADQVFDAVKGYISQRFEPRLTELAEQIKAIPHGPKGEPGKDGEKGADGRDGADGAPGKDGADGVNGKDGNPGADGKDGAPGQDGKDGRDGVHGEKGADGVAGRDGVDGKDGAPGADGKDGINGSHGEKGADGANGLDGVDGKDGASAFELAKAAGFAGDQLEWVKSLQGAAGKDGSDGRDGRDGQKGEPGRDALHLEILPAIDAEKAYPRGTYARHAGGLWRSFETTNGMKGWECIVEGVAEIKVSFVGRTGFVSVERSSGTPDLHPFTLPAMIYRGVFREGDAYEQGDTVTWGGSLWFCNEPTKEKPVDGGKAWQLAAKRGRDGRDGRDGIDKTAPVKLGV